MTKRWRSLLTGAAVLLAVPLSGVVAYLGYTAGYYPYAMVPFALAGVLAVIYVCLLAVLQSF